MPDDTPQWLRWAREIQAIAQIGRHHTEGYYDRKNYSRLLAIAAEMTAAAGNLDNLDVLEAFRVQPGYATVKVDVRGAVIQEGRILLVRERTDGRWCMPGGWADVGELPSESVAREVQEESGILCTPRKVAGVFDANRGAQILDFFHAFKLVMLCDPVGGELRGSDETLEAAYFDFDGLPDLSPGRTHGYHLDEVRAHLADPHRPAYFD